MPNLLMEKIKKNEVALGAWVNSTDPMVTEIFAEFGCDWVFMDTEHEPIGRRDLMALVMACKGTRCTPVVRSPGKARDNMKWILDLGVGGIVVPQMESLADVKEAVNATRYHPLGKRGAGGLRMTAYGRDMGYYQRANNEVVVMIEAEDRWFLENMDAVLTVEGYDAVFVGPMDLSQSMGRLGQPEHPEVEAAIEKIIRRCSAAGKPVVVGVNDEKALRRRRAQGASIFILGSDYRFIRDGIQAKLAAAKSVLGTKCENVVMQSVTDENRT